MPKKFFAAFTAVIMVLSMSFQAMASDVTDLNYNNLFEYIQSDEVTQYIAETIDLREDGLQTVYVGNGIMFAAEVKTTVQPNTRTSSYQTKIGQASGRFYTVSDNQTVAEYSLSAEFEYDGSSYVGIVGTPTRTEETINSSWRLDGYTEILTGENQSIASGQWTLYHKVGFIWTKYEYNNNTHIDIICTAQGTITYNYK